MLIGTVPAATAQDSNDAAAAQDESLEPLPEIPASVDDFLTFYCLDCHTGESADADLDLEAVLVDNHFQSHRDAWEKVQRMLRSREMPPEDMEQPMEGERLELLTWIKDRLDEIDCQGDPFPGRVTLRRLNRAEYNNTIRDLTGVDFQPADSFPSDDVGHGFDNIGDVLAMPPLLVEKYLEAAEQVVTKLFADDALREKVVFCRPGNDSERLECATKVIRQFATRAYRRPITDDEMTRIIGVGMHAYESGANYDQSLQYAMQAILVSPHFLFKVEADPESNDTDGIRELNDYEIAVRLSYFLWSSMPDEELFELASRGQLSQPETLIQQTRRMLQDPKSEALVDNFAGQWLQLRRLEDVQPDPKMFPNFDPALRESMRRETETFFRTVLEENRNVLDFLTADFTYVDEQLAEHYGIPVSFTTDSATPTSEAGTDDAHKSSEMKRVALPANRRGVLTHGSILLITSNPTRTSPVKRGKWILENFLGEPPPPPPQGVQDLEEQPQLIGSLRERMEQHRANEACAVSFHSHT